MTESEAIKKAIRYFESVKNNAVVVIDSGFKTHQEELDLFYRNRIMYAELIINALEKQIPKKPDIEGDGYADGHLVYDTWICPCCNKYYEIEYDEYDYCPNCGQKLIGANKG